MAFRVLIKGKPIRTTVRRGPEGAEVGWADLSELLDALGIPYRRGLWGYQVAIRQFASAVRLQHGWEPRTETFWIGQPPLPPLPDHPVGHDRPPWLPVTPAIAGGPGDRRPDLLLRIIQQFRVAQNPRYRANSQGKGETYCNIYTWDATRALGAEIPHWVTETGGHAAPGQGDELDANNTVTWLRHRGPDAGWRPVSAVTAGEAANQGKPAVAVLYNPNGIGHTAMVRPGAADPVKGLPIAQAGSINSDTLYLVDGFGAAGDRVEFYVHD